jgi:branched-chain amino acid transport system permease protein
MLFDLLPHLLNGLTLGLLFALVALGFMLIVGLMEQINLAHGSLFALGAYLALVLVGGENVISPYLGDTWRTLPLGARYVVALIVAPILVAIVGMGVEVLMRRTYGKDPLFGLLLTFGVAMVLEEAIRATWSTRDYVLSTPGAVSGGFIFQDLIWSTYRFYAAGFAASAIFLVWLFIEKSPYGAVIRPAPTTTKSCERSASTCHDCGCSCSPWALCSPPSPESFWHRSGAFVRTWASMRSSRRFS